MSDTELPSEPGAGRSGQSRWLFWAIGLLALGGAFIYASRPKLPAGPAVSESPGAIKWSHDLAAAKAEAAESGRLLLIDFYGTWCGPCQMMDRTVWPRQDVAEALADWVKVKIDGDKYPDLAARYQIESVPTFFALSPKGQVIGMLGGAWPAEQFIEWVNSMEKRWGESKPGL